MRPAIESARAGRRYGAACGVGAYIRFTQRRTRAKRDTYDRCNWLRNWRDQQPHDDDRLSREAACHALRCGARRRPHAQVRCAPKGRCRHDPCFEGRRAAIQSRSRSRFNQNWALMRKLGRIELGCAVDRAERDPQRERGGRFSELARRPRSWSARGGVLKNYRDIDSEPCVD